MQTTFPDLGAVLGHDYDTLIDVRSPSEFAEDHVPGAISLPVLSDEERARVGTIYKQQSPFLARKIGGALVFRNAATHVETVLALKEGGWRPLVYCWRGGQRSGAFTWMLREIGWRADQLEGGYRTYRRLVSAALYDAALPHRFVQLGGHTGTAKTDLLGHLAARGVQVLDLEGLARHRGSLLGARLGGQPSQKAFETALAATLHALDPARVVVVEAESSKIGEINLPPSLWAAMKSAPWIEVAAPIEARVRYLVAAYADILADGDALREKLSPLRRFRGHALVDAWDAAIGAGDLAGLVRSLMVDHYDPAYDRAQAAIAPEIRTRIAVDALDQDGLASAASRIAAALPDATT